MCLCIFGLFVIRKRFWFTLFDLNKTMYVPF